MVRAATRIPAPAAASRAFGRRRTVAAATSSSRAGIAAGTLRRADSARPPASARNGSSPRNTQRQPNAWPTRAAIDGPMIPGTTQAVDSIANMRGCSRSGRHRPMAVYAVGPTEPAPSPWTKRASTRNGIVGASPPMARPRANKPSPTANGRQSGIRSRAPPVTTMPISEPRKKAE